MEEPDFEIVASTENTPYLLWQALLFHASCVQTQGVAPTVVVHGDGPLLPGFRALGELGSRIVRAPSYRMSDGVEYTCRNTAGSLLEVKHDRPWTLMCDPDFLFLEPLPKKAESLCDGRPVSWDFVSYMQVGDFNRRWLMDACVEHGVDPARVNEVTAGGVVPNFVKKSIHDDFAPRWVSAVDALVRVGRRNGEVPWVTIAWGFALAAWEMDLDLSLTQLTQTSYGGSGAPESALKLPILHYCYGDEIFDKRRHRAAESAADVWKLDAKGSSVSTHFVQKVAKIRDWYRERDVDVADSRLYRNDGSVQQRRTQAPSDIVMHEPETNGTGARYLDSLPLGEAVVGYGSLGTHGSLGYEGKQVTVGGETFRHALSSHAPARLVFELGGRYTRFRCGVALNDDVPVGSARADFTVLADGRFVATAPHVMPGAPQRLEADVRGAQLLELKVDTSFWQCCHTVWLDPEVESDDDEDEGAATLKDCLSRVEFALPRVPPRAKRCIVTVVSAGYADLLDDMLGSLWANANCHDALRVVFSVNPDEACERVIAKHRAISVRCSPLGPMNSTLKALLYSAARVIDAEYFLCLDADMLVLGDLGPVFATLEACPDSSILACRETNGGYYRTLEQALTSVYYGKSTDLERILTVVGDEGAYPLVVNDGLFAGRRSALLALDGTIRSWPEAPVWVDEHPHNSWRNQFVFNLAVARLRAGVELDSTYNVQLFCNDAELGEHRGHVRATWQGKPVRVLHFNGPGRNKYPEWRGLFARVGDPVVGAGNGDAYAEFVAALRAWTGRHGLGSLTRAPNGAADAHTAAVDDPSVFPLFARLHYLLRANGCARVLELRTESGALTACLASAVAHHANGSVVTLDPYDDDRRAGLWAALPSAMHAHIDARATTPLDGMNAALAVGERYDAALLGPAESEELAWAEFQLAVRLVSPGGLILFHDGASDAPAVAPTLERIEAVGYGVARLRAPTASNGARFGLALIENRQRA